MSEEELQALRTLIESEAYAEAISYAKRIDHLAAAQEFNDYAIGLQKIKEYSDAELLLKSASRLNPDEPKIWFNLGMLYSEPEVLAHSPKHLQAAEDAYKKAVEIDPNFDTAHYNLGLLYAFTGRLDEAERCCTRLTDSENPEFEGLRKLLDYKKLMSK